jgi:hypothetical protein
MGSRLALAPLPPVQPDMCGTVVRERLPDSHLTCLEECPADGKMHSTGDYEEAS